METTILAPPRSRVNRIRRKVREKKSVTIFLKRSESALYAYVDPFELRKAVMVLQVFTGKDVIRVVDFLVWNGGAYVTDMWTKLRLGSQSIGSQHLAKLRRINAVTFEREGKKVFYSANEERLLSIWQALETFFGFSKPKES